MFCICWMVRFELARSGVKLRSSTNIIQLERNQPTRSSFSAKSLWSACHNFLANMFNSRNLPVLRRRTGGQMVRRIFAGKVWLIVVKCLGFIFCALQLSRTAALEHDKGYHPVSKFLYPKQCAYLCACVSKDLGLNRVWILNVQSLLPSQFSRLMTL